MANLPTITIIGAGLVGALTATLLAQRGFPVEVFERRADPRAHGFAGGRSINLSLTERGLRPLREAGLAEAVLARSVTMSGRMIHVPGRAAELQPYGIDASEVDHSIARGDLNALLLDAAERAGARIHFDATLVDADVAAGLLVLVDSDGATHRARADLVLGCDGAGSALRAAMNRTRALGERVEPLDHGYKELRIPALAAPSPRPSPPEGGGRHAAARAPASRNVSLSRSLGMEMPCGQRGASADDARFALAPNALHIWPRGRYMGIALPNTAGDFTVTLFLPEAGPYPSFATVPVTARAHAFFAQEFPDLLALMPTFDADWAAHPVGHLGTLYLDRWQLAGRALLLGDAAHAVVPFHGQGMNAGLEDAALIAGALAAHPDDAATAIATFAARRKPDADAIARMSLANYLEMRDGVTDPRYRARRELAAALTARAPRHFMSRYRMVSFTSLPYAFCLARERQQVALLDAILAGHAAFADIDLDAAAARVRAALPPLAADA